MKRIKLKESDLKRVIQRIINESQLLMEKPNCGNTGAPCDPGYICMNPNNGVDETCCCKRGDWRCCEGKGGVADNTGRSTGSMDGGRDYSTFADDDRREMGESARYLREAQNDCDGKAEGDDCTCCNGGGSCGQGTCKDGDCDCPEGGKRIPKDDAMDLRSLKRAEMKEMQRIRARALNERRIILNRSRGRRRY